MKTKVCRNCNKEFIQKYRNNNIFCGKDCYTIFRQNQRIRKSCLRCKKEFFSVNWRKENHNYCSRRCWHETMKLPLSNFICIYCGNNFSILTREVRHANKRGYTPKYCSNTCCVRHLAETGKNIKFHKSTKPEQAVQKILEQLQIDFKHQFVISYNKKVKHYDFFIPSLNTIIEVDGTFWHGKGLRVKDMSFMQKKNHKNDLLKNKMAKKCGYNLVRIWQDEISELKIKELLKI